MATLKQKKLAKKISESIGKDGKIIKPIGKLMREVGYSESTSKTPSLATETKGFIKLMEDSGLTDQFLIDELKDGCQAMKVISCNVIAPNGEGMKDANSMTKDFIEVKDSPTRHKFLTTALEIKKHIKGEGDPTAGRPIIVMPVIMVDGKTKTFDIGDAK